METTEENTGAPPDTGKTPSDEQETEDKDSD